MWATQNSEQHKFSATLFLSRGAAPGLLRYLCFRARLDDFSLLELNSVFLGNFVQLFASELPWRCSRSAATSRKNASSPGGATTQSSNSSLSGFSTPCQTPLGI